LELKELIAKPSNFRSEKLTATRKSAMMMERMVVARVGSMSFRPSLAKIATRAAVMDDSRAKMSHIVGHSFRYKSVGKMPAGAPGRRR